MLARTLGNIRCARDTVQLFVQLGYDAVDQPYEADVWLAAKWKAFKVLAVLDAEPREGARALARRLATTGGRGLAVAVGATELVLAAPNHETGPNTRLLAISLHDASAPALQLLERLRPEGAANALAHAIRVAELLNTERVGERFFTAFRMILERMAASLDRRHNLQDRRMVALLHLTRVLFLYFVQAKGWLDGRHDYLRQLLDESLAAGRDFHRSALEPLFFGTLNRPPRQRSPQLRRSQIPYLNGGLFELHAVERRLRRARFPNLLWRDAFDGVFERFRFCVREADEVDAVAPDMLGRVFERLMEEDERHDTGTFYTPESVVRHIVDAAIETALSGCGGLDADLARATVKLESIPTQSTVTVLEAVKRLRILDPAAGSGAFLLGVLERLTDIQLSLQDAQTPGARCRLRRDILRENLFGVDVNPMAVRLAELRLWLAVVADDPTDSISRVAPLPNLNGVVRQGDTLLDPIGAVRSLNRSGVTARVRKAAQRVEAERCKLFGARGNARSRSLDRLRTAELRLARPVLDQAISCTEYALRDLSSADESHDLFGDRAGLTARQRRQLRIVQRQRTELTRALRSLEGGAIPFFSFEVHAPDVLASGGFSVVVGNPPWVRAERLSAARRRTLQDRFTWWRADRVRGFAHLPDLAIAFLERALELTAPGGAVGMLVPSKAASASYAEPARQYLVRETTIAYLHRVPAREAASFGATTYPLAVVLKKNRPGRDHHVQLGFDRADYVSQRSLSAPGPWILIPGRAHRAIEKLRTSGRPLGSIAPPMLGVKTGADGVFVGVVKAEEDARALIQFAGAEAWIETKLLRPALRGRDVRPFDARPQTVLLWAYDRAGRPLSTLPPLASAHFERHETRLERRADYIGGPSWTLFRTKAAFVRHRVVWRDIARRPQALALDESSSANAVPLNTCYVASLPDGQAALVVAAVLNSVWAAALAAVTADEARGRYRRINARVAAQVPVPNLQADVQKLADLSRLAHRQRDVSDSDIDQAVAEALGLDRQTRTTLRALADDHLR